MNKDEIKDIPSFKDFLHQLNENGRADQARVLSLMAWYLDGMEQQLNSILQKLSNVKVELTQMTEQQLPSKHFADKAVETLDATVGQAQEWLVTFQNRIAESAKDAVKCFKDDGVSALDNAIVAMSVKSGFEQLEKRLENSLISMKDTIEKAEEMRTQLQIGFRNIVNAGRIVVNKELDSESEIGEGRFQFTVLAPMYKAQVVLSDMRNSTLVAIAGMENLEVYKPTSAKKVDAYHRNRTCEKTFSGRWKKESE